ncbi:URACIL-DNA GLYCOSYLASE (UDG) [Mycoplasmopsis pulmonis]|uniref:Uracil-DNA glycosylase n=1 Tax=Mycoplasmopsis pulmonis (strain UAB CTIP) TaxID=272635 RepID=UNG_MYCPU|nr:uracil-DNA glycosylase [Mycoplasmopsis pulmonis]Q98PV4.1 RecName: Full=Uracil-DNA glycosylase; Short=UDG [Mycoplasmopsis pulmonis UAB CTIP]MDZ7293584.1 uracil-DNA glycosylase [Mycoplasmopsis pulmonis]CAC13788.1 URACIL-DNA GLYCOSYLASE (UDG) [Mycoplasmopsis pulmonis]VEU68376.1 uracil-DNA glycosylase [Mycoplasmopsis pulmonis]
MNKEQRWKSFFEKEKAQKYFKDELWPFLENEYKNKIIFPKKEDIFKAFDLVDFNNLKVVIIGQDPYINENQAHGLAFSTLDFLLPKSLKNIFIELKNNYPNVVLKSGNLTSWASQGILLLNRVLSVEKGLSSSHYNRGWEIFTFNVIDYISKNFENIIFVLWGKKAQDLKKDINFKNHFILESSHPSPFSANISFFGSQIFLKINKILEQINKEKINWNIE